MGLEINTPIWANSWSVDEVAECLPGMLSSGAYDALWAEVDEERRVTLDEVWVGLSTEHQQAIIDGYTKEYEVA